MFLRERTRELAFKMERSFSSEGEGYAIRRSSGVSGGKKTEHLIHTGKRPAGFLQRLSAEVSSYAKIRRKNFREEEYILPEAAFRFYLDMPRQDQISCRPVAVYGETNYNLLREDQEPSKRDLFHEAEIQELLTPWFNAFDRKKSSWY